MDPLKDLEVYCGFPNIKLVKQIQIKTQFHLTLAHFFMAEYWDKVHYSDK